MDITISITHPLTLEEQVNEIDQCSGENSTLVNKEMRGTWMVIKKKEEW